MTTPDDRDERREKQQRADVQRLVGAVRAASAPGPSDGASQRIADGAWARAGMDTPASEHTPSRARIRIGHRTRRWTVAAAALLLVTIGSLALRPTETVFAVEGDPVSVWDDDGWSETRRVRPGATVFVDDGFRTLRGRGTLEGESILPDPGTTFRIVMTEGGSQHVTVELLGGTTEVRGGSVRLSISDVDVAPRTAHAVYHVRGSLERPGGDPVSPDARVRTLRDAMPRVVMRMGDATIVCRSTGQQMDLADEEMAALLPVSLSGRTIHRLGRMQRFDPTLGVHIASGHPVLDVRENSGGAIAVLGGPNDVITGVAIDSTELTTALDQMNTAMLAFVSEVRIGGNGEGAIWIGAPGSLDVESLEARAVDAGHTLTEISMSRDGESVRVVVDGAGVVQVERNGVVHEYPSLDAARDADPDALELLSPYLKR